MAISIIKNGQSRHKKLDVSVKNRKLHSSGRRWYGEGGGFFSASCRMFVGLTRHGAT